MKIQKISILFAAIFIATIVIPLAIPLTNSLPTHHKATHAYIGATPNPLGVGQQTLIHIGITDELRTRAIWMERINRNRH